MKKILIPTDFSENSDNAIKFALDYYARCRATFYLLHVSQNRLPDSVNNISEPVRNPEKKLEQEKEKWENYRPESRHRLMVLQGEASLVEAVRKWIREKEIDMIVMGTKGNLFSDHSEAASNTYEILTKVKCPILVIPENANFEGIRNISFITDYNCLYKNRVIQSLSEALTIHKVPLRVLNLRPQNTGLTQRQIENKGFLHFFIKDIRHSFHFMENKNVEAGIQEFFDVWDIGLVSIPAKNLNFIQRLMLRPTTPSIDYHARMPFLVLHE